MSKQIRTPYRNELPKNGKLIEAKKFKAACKDNILIDYDGFGYPVKNNLINPDIRIKPSEWPNIPETCTHILWLSREEL